MDPEHKSDFLAIIASSIHDMKNSLNTLINTVDELGDRKDIPEHYHNSFNIIQTEGQRLGNSFTQMLTLYRIEENKYFAGIDQHNVYDCLEELALENRPLLERREQVLDVICPSDLTGYFDRALVMGVLNSVINNACRYAKHAVTLRAEQSDGRLTFSVLDDGPGYPEQVLDNARHTSLDLVGGQTGLGLHFAATVAALHKNGTEKGTIELSNRENSSGACFVLKIP